MCYYYVWSQMNYEHARLFAYLSSLIIQDDSSAVRKFTIAVGLIRPCMAAIHQCGLSGSNHTPISLH